MSNISAQISADIDSIAAKEQGVAQEQEPSPQQQPKPSARTRKPVPKLGSAGEQTRPNGRVYKPRSLASHEDVTLMRKAREKQQHVLLMGPPGTGKTALAEAACPGFATLHGSADISEPDMLGNFIQDKDGKYVWKNGVLTQSLLDGVPLLIDEIAVIDPRVLTSLYSLMDGRGELVIHMNPELDPIKVPEGWFVIGTCNPDVVGADLSDALRSRFSHHIDFPSDYELAREEGVDSQLVTIAENLNNDEEIGWAPQYRELEQYQELVDDFGEAYAIGNLINQAPPEFRDQVQMKLAESFPGARGLRVGGRYGR